MIRIKCNKDHTVKNEGKLTVCEMKDYLTNGGYSHDSKGNKIRAFAGDVKGRFQFEGAK
jgi:hypothetical protein